MPSTISTPDRVIDPVSSPSERPSDTQDAYKGTIAERVAQDIARDQQGILGQLKWLMRANKQNEGNGNIPPEELKENILGKLRAEIMENICLEVPVFEGETIFSSSGAEKKAITILPVQEITGSHTKQNMIMDILKWGFDNHMLAGVYPHDENLSEEENNRRALEAAYQMYAAKPEGEKPAGEIYQKTTMPDGMIVYDGTVEGVMETKAYSPEEVAMLAKKMLEQNGTVTAVSVGYSELGRSYLGTEPTMKLGADFEGELAFSDFVRSIWNDKEELGADGTIVYRFPSLPESDPRYEEYKANLRTIGEQMNKAGYNVVIQTIPFSTEELNNMASSFIKFSMDKVTEGDIGQQFSRREIEQLQSIANDTKEDVVPHTQNNYYPYYDPEYAHDESEEPKAVRDRKRKIIEESVDEELQKAQRIGIVRVLEEERPDRVENIRNGIDTWVRALKPDQVNDVVDNITLAVDDDALIEGILSGEETFQTRYAKAASILIRTAAKVLSENPNEAPKQSTLIQARAIVQNHLQGLIQQRSEKAES